MTFPASETTGFLTYGRLELGLGQNTLDAYANDLRKLDEACVVLGYASAADLGPEEIGKLLAWLRDERAQAPASLARALVTLRMFARWLVLERRLDRDRIALAPMPALWNELPEVLSAEQVELCLLYTSDAADE